MELETLITQSQLLQVRSITIENVTRQRHLPYDFSKRASKQNDIQHRLESVREKLADCR